MNEILTEAEVVEMKNIVVLTAVILMALSTNLAAQPDEAYASHKVMGKLNLTEAQKKDVDKIRFDSEKQAIAQRAKLATARLDLRQLLKADNPDKAAIEKKLNEIADLRVQQHMIRLDAWFSINKLLTPEQQKTWREVLANAPAMQGNMMHRNKMQRDMMNHWGGKRQMNPMMHPDKPASN